MKILDVICAKGTAGFYFDDQRAIKAGAKLDGFVYTGSPKTEGYTAIRQQGESISVLLILEDGQVAYGDCAAVQYSGVGGRDPLFIAEDFISIIENQIAVELKERELISFKNLAGKIDKMKVNGVRLHTAIRYGVTQAILDAVAKAKKVTMAEVIQEEYDTGIKIKRIPIFAQSGDDRYCNVDKMIIKGVDAMPHALINNVDEKLGRSGEKLHNYIEWMRNRVLNLRLDENYSPIFHIDVYGTIGLAFENDINKMANCIIKAEELASPFKLRIEGPMDVDNREGQMEILRDLRKELEVRGSKAEIVADEWCNTLEDVVYFSDNKAGHMLQIKAPDLGGVNNLIKALLYAKKAGIGAYCGGTCNETNRSAEICTQIAMGCGADQCLAKPGMGVDEGYMIVNNEMNRVLALINKRNKSTR